MLTRLMDAPRLPGLHVAVISSDMGAGDGSIAAAARPAARAGPFQYTARGTCPATSLSPGATFISDDGAARNYTGHLAEVFTCIAAVGESGGGFEQPLAAIRARSAPTAGRAGGNLGFLRPDAYLLIVLLTQRGRLLGAVGITTVR